MSIFNVTASGYTVTPNGMNAVNATTTGTKSLSTFTAKGDVFTGTPSTANAVQPSLHVTNPGVFTAGTAPEGTVSNTTNDVQV